VHIRSALTLRFAISLSPRKKHSGRGDSPQKALRARGLSAKSTPGEGTLRKKRSGRGDSPQKALRARGLSAKSAPGEGTVREKHSGRGEKPFKEPLSRLRERAG